MIEFSEATLYHPRQGDVAEFYSAGGGGYGDPLERAVEAVVADVAAGLLSVENAREEYGVVVDPDTLALELVETERLRRDRDSIAP